MTAPDELIIGVRDDPNPKMGDTFGERRGVRLYKCTDGKGAKWTAPFSKTAALQWKT